MKLPTVILRNRSIASATRLFVYTTSATSLTCLLYMYQYLFGHQPEPRFERTCSSGTCPSHRFVPCTF